MIAGLEDLGDVSGAAYIGGRWVPATERADLAVTDAATEEVFARVPEASSADVDHAVGAARAAIPGWMSRPPGERADLLRALADALENQRDPLALVIAREVGTPLAESRAQQVATALHTLRVAAELACAVEANTTLGQTRVSRRPIGVVACIVPWNYPLYLTTTKVAPALAAGCTVVVKPSEVAPLSVLALARAAHAVGLPPGVLNVISGTGVTVGAQLVSHSLVDAVSFTGSRMTGAQVAAAAGAALHRVTLELGGKSPSVVLDDADLEQAVNGTVRKGFQNAGQTCAALTRLIVPRRRLADAEALAADAAGRLVCGNPLDAKTTLGPVASAAQRARVQTSIAEAMASGAKLVTGGTGLPVGLSKGYHVKPTVFSGASRDMALVREEIFGPVLAIQSYRSEREAVELANDSKYGLSAAVWSADPERALRVAEQLEAGSVSINGAPTHPDAPFGGFKQSGFGRERGRHGVDEFLTTKAVHGDRARRLTREY